MINPVQIVLALLLAVLANHKVRGITFYRTIFFIPIGISVPIAALLWQTMLDPNSGLLNALLSAVGLPRQPFLTSADQALWSVIAIASWKGVSFWMVFLLGGLQAIPFDLHEAAMLDGASATRRFLQITLPLLKRTILFVLVTDTAINLLLFAPVYLLTRGGPELSTNVLMYEAFKTGFVYTDMGLALAMVMVLLGLVLVVVAAEFRLLQTREDAGCRHDRSPLPNASCFTSSTYSSASLWWDHCCGRWRRRSGPGTRFLSSSCPFHSRRSTQRLRPSRPIA